MFYVIFYVTVNHDEYGRVMPKISTVKLTVSHHSPLEKTNIFKALITLSPCNYTTTCHSNSHFID